jgi:hypothetical protein
MYRKYATAYLIRYAVVTGSMPEILLSRRLGSGDWEESEVWVSNTRRMYELDILLENPKPYSRPVWPKAD